MPTVYNVSAAAAIVGTSPSTLRNWIKTFAPYLSPTATPAPGTERILTPADVATLQYIKAQRDALKDYEQIAAELAAMPVDATTTPYIDVQAITSTVEPLQAPTMPTDIMKALQVLADDRYSALQQRVEAMERRQVSMLTWFAMGIVAGVLLVGVVAAIVLVGAWMGR